MKVVPRFAFCSVTSRIFSGAKSPVVGIRNVVQARDEQQPDRLGQVQVLAGRGQHLVHLTQVGTHHLGRMLVRHQRFGVQEHDRVVVDVDHPCIRITRLGDLVRVRTDRQAGPDIEELADPAVAQETRNPSTGPRAPGRPVRSHFGCYAADCDIRPPG